jgi:hypothetical protein
MSVVSLNGPKGSISIDQLHNLSSKTVFKIPKKDEEDYLLLLNAAGSAIQQVDQLPGFVDPRLVPLPGTRTFFKPKEAENPLGAWSHKVSSLTNFC